MKPFFDSSGDASLAGPYFELSAQEGFKAMKGNISMTSLFDFKIGGTVPTPYGVSVNGELHIHLDEMLKE